MLLQYIYSIFFVSLVFTSLLGVLWTSRCDHPINKEMAKLFIYHSSRLKSKRTYTFNNKCFVFTNYKKSKVKSSFKTRVKINDKHDYQDIFFSK